MSVQYRDLLSVAECLKLRARQCDDAIGAVRGADPRCDALRDEGRALERHGKIHPNGGAHVPR